MKSRIRIFAVVAGLSCLTLAAPAAVQAQSGFGSPDDPPIVYHLGPVGVVGNDSDQLQFGIGAFDVIANEGPDKGVYHGGTEVEGRIEYRLGRKFYGVGPLLGISVNGDGGVYGYAALYSDLSIGSWYVSPSLGLGGYDRGNGKELGSTFLFHLGLDAGYRFDNGTRIGLKMTHISNAYLYDDNPGNESALITYTIPLDLY